MEYRTDSKLSIYHMLSEHNILFYQSFIIRLYRFFSKLEKMITLHCHNDQAQASIIFILDCPFKKEKTWYVHKVNQYVV